MKLGLGTGSTANHFVELLGDRVRAGLAVTAVASSEATQAFAQKLGMTLSTLDETPQLDLTVDGSDVTLSWPPGMSGTAFTVNYRAASQDGHPVSGSIAFTVDTPPSGGVAASSVLMLPIGERSASGWPVPRMRRRPATGARRG